MDGESWVSLCVTLVRVVLEMNEKGSSGTSISSARAIRVRSLVASTVDSIRWAMDVIFEHGYAMCSNFIKENESK